MTTCKPTASAEVVAWMMTCDQYRRPPEFSRDRPTAVPPVCEVTGLVPLPDYEALQRRIAELEAAIPLRMPEDCDEYSEPWAAGIARGWNSCVDKIAAMRSKGEEHAD
jgi:hypothetical protein